MKENGKNEIKKNSEQEKYLREKVISCMSSGKCMIIHLLARLIKKLLYKMSQYFPKSFEPFGGF